MTSGYSAEGRSRWAGENADWSFTPYTPEKPHFVPGTHFEYWDEAQMMYGKVLTNILGKTMKEYLTEKLEEEKRSGETEKEEKKRKTNEKPHQRTRLSLRPVFGVESLPALVPSFCSSSADMFCLSLNAGLRRNAGFVMVMVRGSFFEGCLAYIPIMPYRALRLAGRSRKRAVARCG
jgi:hypothetical protein